MDITVEQVDLLAARTLVIKGHCNFASLTEFLGSAFAETAAAATTQGLAFAGPPFGRYRPTEDGWDVEAGFPVVGTPVAVGRVRAGALPGGLAAKVLHTGRYDEVGSAYQAIETWLADSGSTATAQGWESYLDETNAPNPRTAIIQPYAPAKDTNGADAWAQSGV